MNSERAFDVYYRIHTVSLILFALVVSMLFLGRLEGDLFPPAEKAYIDLSSVITTEKGVQFSGTSYKNRDTCSFVDVFGYLHNNNKLTVPVEIITEPPKVRGSGRFEFTDWLAVGLTEHDLVHRLELVTYHSCRTSIGSLFGALSAGQPQLYYVITNWYNGKAVK